MSWLDTTGNTREPNHSNVKSVKDPLRDLIIWPYIWRDICPKFIRDVEATGSFLFYQFSSFIHFFTHFWYYRDFLLMTFLSILILQHQEMKFPCPRNISSIFSSWNSIFHVFSLFCIMIFHTINTTRISKMLCSKLVCQFVLSCG